MKWSGNVESKLIWLFKALEGDFPKALFRPYIWPFQVQTEEYAFGQGFFIGLKLTGYTHINLQGIILPFCSMISELQKEGCFYYIKLQNIRDIEDGIRNQLRY